VNPLNRLLPFSFPLCVKEFDLEANQYLLAKYIKNKWGAVGPIGYRFMVGHLYQERL